MGQSQDGDQSSRPGAQQQRRGFLPPELMELILPPAKVGAGTGALGVLAGVGGAIARDTSPFASGFVSGVQWFTLGGSYWFTRTVAMKSLGGEESLRPIDKVGVSAVSGSAAGAVTGLMRGPTKIIPGMILWGVLGAGGQAIANRSASRAGQSGDGTGLLSKLNPLKKLSDKEYLDMMNEKILRAEVDIALIDDRIAELRKQGQAEDRGSQPGGGK